VIGKKTKQVVIGPLERFLVHLVSHRKGGKDLYDLLFEINYGCREWACHKNGPFLIFSWHPTINMPLVCKSVTVLTSSSYSLHKTP